jgi:hypothetical protein
MRKWSQELTTSQLSSTYYYMQPVSLGLPCNIRLASRHLSSSICARAIVLTSKSELTIILITMRRPFFCLSQQTFKGLFILTRRDRHVFVVQLLPGRPKRVELFRQRASLDHGVGDVLTGCSGSFLFFPYCRLMGSGCDRMRVCRMFCRCKTAEIGLIRAPL